MKATNMRHCSALFFCIIIIISSIFVQATDSKNITCPIQSIYQFGDSISDTGNLIRILPFGPVVSANRLPYGETFPGNPTGRWSDGRLIIDFIAQALGLPLLNPYLNKSASFDNGVNFAVAGSTTLDFNFYLSMGIVTNPVPSLEPQLQWFKTYFRSICSTPTECSNKLSRALFFVGEIGYNDVAIAYGQGRSLDVIRSYLPQVVQTIINTTRELITYGATQVVVPGNFPLGCFPYFQSRLPKALDPTAYDDLGCLKSVNNLTSYQNNILQMSLNSLRNEFPNVVILYADFYNTFLTVLRNAPNLGFDNATLFKACCGANVGYTPTISPGYCANLGAPVCPDPNVYIHWDGIHLTQEAYSRISEILVKDLGFNCTGKLDARG